MCLWPLHGSPSGVCVCVYLCVHVCGVAGETVLKFFKLNPGSVNSPSEELHDLTQQDPHVNSPATLA